MASLLALPTLAGCDGGDDDGSDTNAETETSADAGDGDTTEDTGDGDGTGDTGMDVGNCAAACAAIEACGQAAYDASPSFGSEDECNSYCQGQYETFEVDGCGDAFGDTQTCLAALSCEDITAYLGDPIAAGVCTDENNALVECLP